MADVTTYWDDGQKKWLRRSEVQKARKDIQDQYDFDNIITTTLGACDIKTDIQGVSWMVEHNSTVLKHWDISDMKHWQVQQNVMTIFTTSEYPLKLVFVSVGHARRADTRLYLIMNGENIINCNDDLMFQCGDLQNLNVSF